ncbi:hypothetical protein TA3x_000858 [Tundrisphaera sp. TA3]|uniref:hypothetical protein n=1 Tax=Tundrisphaera sp. TA3 TaxID=3435775 RepID=UPI003EB736F0
MIGPRAMRAALILAIGMSWAASAARGGERYFVIIFGSQSQPKRLRYTHTWATFVRVAGEGNPATDPAEVHTISWLPATLEVRVWAARPEPGVNLDLEASIAAVTAQGESITAWGPFEIGRRGYDRSLAVRSSLESGAIEYRAISTRLDLTISDCIHAVAAVDPEFGRDNYPLIRIGKPASRHIAREVHLRSPFPQEGTGAEALFPRLGLSHLPIEIVPPERIPYRRCGLCRIPE